MKKRKKKLNELQRLQEIEHAAWHVCESSEERVMDKEIVVWNPDYEKLSALLPEEHPEARSDLVLVTRAFLESLKCPNTRCIGGYITNTGPDPQHDPCEWCERRDRFLAGELPINPKGEHDGQESQESQETPRPQGA